jgi:hypothetical protein
MVERREICQETGANSEQTGEDYFPPESKVTKLHALKIMHFRYFDNQLIGLDI